MYEFSPKSNIKATAALSREEDRYLSESSRYTPLVKPSALIAVSFVGLGLANRSVRRLAIPGAFLAGISTGITFFSGEKAKIKADSMKKRADVLRHMRRTTLSR